MKLRAVSAALLVVLIGPVIPVQASSRHHQGRHHHPSVIAGLHAPVLQSPANHTRVQQIPALTWDAVSGATEYEYELAADPSFHSIVLGKGMGKGSAQTHNLAASLDKSLADGTYYWRVRGLTKGKAAGPWSSVWSVVKSWSDTPQLVSPGEHAAITWPTVPLVLHWTQVASATEYIVTIATDPTLSNVVLGTASAPTKTWATVFSLPKTLHAGTYYWAITPVDAAGHRGTRSAIRSFTWSWPTTTATSVTPLNDPPGATELEWTPEFTWNSVPGAARYEVQVSSAEGFPAGSIWSDTTTIGTSYSPTVALNNNEYYWRVRAIDPSGNAGIWNEGRRFTKTFDNQTPTIPNLQMVDINEHPMPADPTTETPIVKWAPVPGAASYEVQVGQIENGACGPLKAFRTSSLAWTPLAKSAKIGQENWPSPQGQAADLKLGASYCVLVAPQSDKDAFGNLIEGGQTPIGGYYEAAFTYDTRLDRCGRARADEIKAEQLEKEGKVAEAGTKRSEAQKIYATYEYLSLSECETILANPVPTEATPASAYVAPRGTTTPRTPLFTWKPVPGASEYYVVIARNRQFTNVVDVAKTQGNAYAPPIGDEEPLDDETTNYYWAVLPATAGYHVGTPESNNYQEFNKNSVPPTPLAPSEGAEVSSQPTFKWTPVTGETSEGALNYTVQVAVDPSFANPIDNIVTDSTSYTSSSTYPAYRTLYWRVRVNDTNGNHHEGLNWSRVQTFQRTLPQPTPSPSNQTSGAAIPSLTWTSVPGAIAYEVHAEQPDGTTKEVTLDSTAFTATEWDGPGVWHWQVRADFPQNSFGTVPGAYSGQQTFTHTVEPPSSAIGTKSGSRILISWNPQPYAREYEVQISTSDTFSPSSVIESSRTDTSYWAPNIDVTRPTNRGTLYWRVATIDNRNNVGPFATGAFGKSSPAPKPKCVRGGRKAKGHKVPRKCSSHKNRHKHRHH